MKTRRCDKDFHFQDRIQYVVPSSLSHRKLMNTKTMPTVGIDAPKRLPNRACNRHSTWQIFNIRVCPRDPYNVSRCFVSIACTSDFLETKFIKCVQNQRTSYTHIPLIGKANTPAVTCTEISENRKYHDYLSMRATLSFAFFLKITVTR